VAVKAVQEQAMEQMAQLTQEEVVEVREDFRRHWLAARADRAL
jgi:hypothetical protein